uniref:Dolichyl-diphosphooligosaccharide-protein glycosyltransferase subunit TMEM258 n=1 Tax=Seriola dumerili TaxID=41447 RepID=A0A3B4UHZ7_SERDU
MTKQDIPMCHYGLWISSLRWCSLSNPPGCAPSLSVSLSLQELEAMTRYTSPVNPAVFPHLTVVLLAIGMFFTAWFFVYEVTSTKYTRDVYKELLISLVASLFMGFGVLFLLLWVGIYV